jgi:hypothetical protein
MWLKMKSEKIDIRPDCDQIIKSKQFWATDLNDIKVNVQLNEYFKVQSIDAFFINTLFNKN